MPVAPPSSPHPASSQVDVGATPSSAPPPRASAAAIQVQLQAALAYAAPTLPLAVAFSGGADSTALLLACWQRWPGQVGAVHVHHGLQAAADTFETFCRSFCAQRGIALQVERRDARPRSGESPEDAARKARYAALAQGVQALAPSLEQPVASIALAQHADDQVETLLLALSRGAGLPGLAAMPSHWQQHGLHWHRPWLDQPGTVLRDWLRAQQQDWVEDPTNADPHYTRNRIRLHVLPALQQAFPQFRSTFSRSSAHASQAQLLLDEVAADDLRTVGQPPRIAHLRQLSFARQANVLRHWLRHCHGAIASSAQLQQLQHQLQACTTRGHRIHLKVASGFALRQGEHLVWVK